MRRAGFEAAQATFLAWLNSGLSGCWFASNVARGTSRIALPIVGRDLKVDLVESALDQYSKRGVPTIALFPWVAAESNLVEIIATLAQRPRWRVRIVDGLDIPRACTPVGVWYETTNGELSSAMGFAPLLAMPVTRRAPLVAIGAWAGGYENQFIKRRNGLSFLHMPQACDLETFRKRQDLSRTWTQEAIADERDPSSLYYQVAFCLSPEARAPLEARGIRAQ